MKPELAALAKHRMAQAHETLAEAEQLLASQAFRGAVNRLYYAAFYAARALLATRDMEKAGTWYRRRAKSLILRYRSAKS